MPFWFDSYKNRSYHFCRHNQWSCQTYTLTRLPFSFLVRLNKIEWILGRTWSSSKTIFAICDITCLEFSTRNAQIEFKKFLISIKFVLKWRHTFFCIDSVVFETESWIFSTKKSNKNNRHKHNLLRSRSTTYLLGSICQSVPRKSRTDTNANTNANTNTKHTTLNGCATPATRVHDGQSRGTSAGADDLSPCE